MWALYEACQTQWRSGGFGVIGLDYPTLFMVADRMSIKVDELMLEKLRQLEFLVLKKQSEPSKKKDGDV